MIRTSFLIFTNLLILINMYSEKDKIIQSVKTYIAAGDSRNAAQLDTVLYSNFRAVFNQLLGSNEVKIVSKELYLQLIADGKLGGDSRSVDILAVDIVENNATVKAKLKGETLTFESFYQLIKVNGSWQLIQDLPFATKN
jgi:hypothetical protein